MSSIAVNTILNIAKALNHSEVLLITHYNQWTVVYYNKYKIGLHCCQFIKMNLNHNHEVLEPTPSLFSIDVI